VKAEQTAHAEHGDEPEQHRGRGNPGDVKSQVDGAQQAAEDVVHDQGEQEQRASHQEADSED
jgi:hypothetical protein